MAALEGSVLAEDISNWETMVGRGERFIMRNISCSSVKENIPRWSPWVVRGHGGGKAAYYLATLQEAGVSKRWYHRILLQKYIYY